MRTERDTLVYYLDAQRRSVLEILDGLDERALRQAVVPSGWTPIELIRHLGGAERYWFGTVLTGEASKTALTCEVPVPDPAADGPAVIRFYREQAKWSNRRVSTVALDAQPLGQVPLDMVTDITDVRSLILHVIEETARHAGHLDLAREMIDGRTGLGPR